MADAVNLSLAVMGFSAEDLLEVSQDLVVVFPIFYIFLDIGHHVKNCFVRAAVKVSAEGGDPRRNSHVGICAA